MKYKQYPSYKDSGIQWVGDIPEYWISIRAKWLFVRKQRPIRNTDDIVTAFRDGMVTLRKNRRTSGFTNAIHEHGYQGIRSGDLVIHAMDAFAGAIGVSDSDGKSTPVYSVCVPRNSHRVYTKYYGVLLRTMSERKYIEALSKGIRERSTEFRFNEFSVLNLPLPPLSDQKSIANYLDKATTKIDTLIEKQTKLIELLKEKRQAVISSAVTRGLDASVPMKCSGVEWLGEIPEHWGTTKIKYIVSVPITDGPHETPEFLDEGVPFISAESVSKGYINFDKKRGHISIEDDRKYSLKYSPKLYDIYMVKSGATTGVSAIVETNIKFNIWSPLAVFRCGSKTEPYFALNFIRSRNFIEAIELNWSFGTQQNIGMSVIENLSISMPPTQEQKVIANYLEKATSKIDNLITKSTQAVVLLKEKRTALISAAVTGKIDVRDAA